ncbi:ATP-binding cassette domain-containing protein [Olsenella sp. AGMB03486]|uniref:ATP-binding cassette domain-containing protein n=1 Tax=Olsenella sp. AGMB03486 TaxID=3230364 RepID=UPI0034A03A9D
MSLEVPAGRIVGFVGRNGARKTTTLRCVAGAARADGGRVAAFGRDAAEDWAAMRRLTGIVLGGALYYETKTLAAIAGVTSRIFDSWDVRAFDALARRFSLDTGKRVRELSQGKHVKFALALALSHGARLIVLDEPTSGLDPLSRDELLGLFLDLVADEERTASSSRRVSPRSRQVRDGHRAHRGRARRGGLPARGIPRAFALLGRRRCGARAPASWGRGGLRPARPRLSPPRRGSARLPTSTSRMLMAI